MANEEHEKIIMQGVEVWNNWRGENPDVRPELSAAGLQYANLQRANLQRANLERANLRGANLFRANLRGANLFNASLIGANLQYADFEEAMIWETIFGAVNLSYAKGLEKVEHRGPSIIGIETIYESNGQIPEAFLRGAGVSDDFIDYMERRWPEFRRCDREQTEELENLSLYLQYDYLPIQQYSTIISTIEGVYSGVADIYCLPESKTLSLCIESVWSGESIFTKISFDREFSQRIEETDKGSTELVFPKWSCILILTAIILQWGQDRYKTQLEIKNLKLNNERIEKKLAEMDLKRLQDYSDTRVNQIDIYVNTFHREINQSNIKLAKLNGYILKLPEVTTDKTTL